MQHNVLDFVTKTRTGEPRPAETPAIIEARRTMEVCNACRYCEGYCAVFPAMTLKREFEEADLTYLANLCHSCRGCYYACQYAPPHEFGINVPKVLAEVRTESYQAHAWPQAVAVAFERNGLVVSLSAALAIVVVLLGTAFFNGSAMFQAHASTPGGGFYKAVPYAVMVSVAGAIFAYAALAMFIGLIRFWKTVGLGLRDAVEPRTLFQALKDAATLRYLGGGGDGCNDVDASFSTSRRRFHHAMAYGFLLCFASTSTGTVYDHLLGWPAPYPFFSLPVLLGTVGGIGIVIGTLGLLWLKLVGDQEPRSKAQLGADTALLVLLFLISVTGLLLLALRTTAAMGVILTVHLGLVFSFFATMPYSKFVHGLYRTVALVRYAVERKALASGTTEEAS